MFELGAWDSWSISRILSNKIVSVLTECWNHDGTPNKFNFRHECAKLMQAHGEHEPWFGLEQEYTLLDLNDRPYGWPQNVSASPCSENSPASSCDEC
jgi:glutamine synthetase